MQPTRTVVGVDIAKRVFQLHWVDTETGEIMKLRLARRKFLEHFANRRPCLIGMEACGGAQHWARRLLTLGHSVRSLPAKMVRPFVSGNKNDAADAEAIWTTVQQPGLKTVTVKCEEAAGNSGTPPHAPATGEVPDRPDQRAARSADRIRRSHAPRPSRVEARPWPRPSSGSRSGCRRWSSRRCASSGRG